MRGVAGGNPRGGSPRRAACLSASLTGFAARVGTVTTETLDESAMVHSSARYSQAS